MRPILLTRILIVDDHADIRHILRLILESQGYFCDEAENGEKGVEKIHMEYFDLVLLDYHMPTMNGFQFLKTVSRLSHHSRIPVILMTGSSSEDLQNQKLPAGVVGRLEKPCDLETLLLAIPLALTGSFLN